MSLTVNNKRSYPRRTTSRSAIVHDLGLRSDQTDMLVSLTVGKVDAGVAV